MVDAKSSKIIHAQKLFSRGAEQQKGSRGGEENKMQWKNWTCDVVVSVTYLDIQRIEEPRIATPPTFHSLALTLSTRDEKLFEILFKIAFSFGCFVAYLDDNDNEATKGGDIVIFLLII